MMRTVLILVITFLITLAINRGTKYGSRLHPVWFWNVMIAGIIVYGVLILTQTYFWLLINGIVIMMAIILANALGKSIKSSTALAVFCISAAIIDLISFSGGLTSKIISNYEQGTDITLLFLCITIPFSSKLVPVLGIGDLIIIGTIYSVLRQLGHDDLFSFLLPFMGLLSALIIGLIWGGIFAIPFISSTTLIYLFWQSKLPSP